MTQSTMAPEGVVPGRVYRLTEAMTLLGWGRHAMRAARRAGLRVVYRHARAYVHADDIIRYLDRDPEASTETAAD
jgi:hypothetical protein